MYNILWIIILLIGNGCVKKETNNPPKVSDSTVQTAGDLQKNSSDKKSPKGALDPKKSQANQKFYNTDEFLEVIEFAASIEKEAFRLATANVKNEKKQILQLETLSYALNSIFSPKNLPKNISLDCKLYGYKENSKTEISLTRNCMKPNPMIAQITQLDLNQYRITFFQREWSATLGSAVSFANNNRTCTLKLKSEKLSMMTCENTLYSLSAEASLEELRLNQITFNRESKDQLIVTGARYKDLIERSKIQVRVPLEGKIKIMEKELEVHDDFEKIVNPDAAPAEPAPSNPNLKSTDNSVQITGPIRDGNDPQERDAYHEENNNSQEDNENGQNQNSQQNQYENDQQKNYEGQRGQSR